MWAMVGAVKVCAWMQIKEKEDMSTVGFQGAMVVSGLKERSLCFYSLQVF